MAEVSASPPAYLFQQTAKHMSTPAVGVLFLSVPARLQASFAHGGTMNKDLQSLRKLQQIDLQIFEFNQSKREYPIEVDRLASAIAEAEKSVASVQKKIEDLAAERRNVEEQIVQAKQSLERSEERLNSITTNREYDAVHSEIETHKHVVVNGESRLKNFQEDAERLQTQKKEAEEEVERVRGENGPKIDELNAKIASIDSDIAASKAQRDAMLPGISRQYLRTYDHIHKRRKNGRVISLVSLADGTCAICHKILEPQLLNEIRKSNRLHICESCGSILLWNAEEVNEGAAEGGTPPKQPAGDLQQ
jgi:predicted  nucleic acid-binding Zn-ribbon protein